MFLSKSLRVQVTRESQTFHTHITKQNPRPEALIKLSFVYASTRQGAIEKGISSSCWMLFRGGLKLRKQYGLRELVLHLNTFIILITAFISWQPELCHLFSTRMITQFWSLSLPENSKVGKMFLLGKWLLLRKAIERGLLGYSTCRTTTDNKIKFKVQSIPSQLFKSEVHVFWAIKSYLNDDCSHTGFQNSHLPLVRKTDSPVLKWLSKSCYNRLKPTDSVYIFWGNKPINGL